MPSGTALMLANSANDALEEDFTLSMEERQSFTYKDEIAIHAVRGVLLWVNTRFLRRG